MTYSEFHTRTYAKWILAGEHAVIRGYGALVFPLKKKQLTLSYHPHPSCFSIENRSDPSPLLPLLIQQVLEHGAQLLAYRTPLTGTFYCESTIPIGQGLGASAAICMAASRFFVAQHRLPEEATVTFAKTLENLFHGQSSGIDIVGTAAEQGLYFQQGQTASFNQVWKPEWYISFCQEQGITAQCIQQVQILSEKDPLKARTIDENMHSAVQKARFALQQKDAIHLLKESIQEATACFAAWGLLSPALINHMQYLKQAGALATKPTGSGGGGYVLSLWAEPPAKSFIHAAKLIKITT